MLFKGTTFSKILAGISSGIFILLFVVSCDNDDNNHNGDPQAIRNQITEYNEQIVELNQKISNLERELEQLGERAQSRTRTPISVTEINLQAFEHYFETNASVEAVKEAMISPESNGQIRSILVNKGQRVSKGQELARLNTSVIENNIEEVQTSLELAQTVYNRQKSLWEQEIGSEIQYLEARNNYNSMQARLKSLNSQLDMAVMRAPFDGIVDDIFAKEGELAMPGVIVMQIINLNLLYINADVSESFLPNINSSDRVILRFPSFPDYEQSVPIHRLGNVINPENRTFRLQVRIANTGERFKPNMTATMSIPSYSTQEAIVVPSILIKQDVQGYFVFTAISNEEGDQVAHKVYIERGRTSEGKTMIESGLSKGDLLISQGHNRVNDGTLLEIMEKRDLTQN